MTPVFLGTVKDGKLLLDKTEQFKAHLSSFPTGKRVEVSVEKITHPRTNSQNRWYWGCVVKLIAEHTGNDPEQVHELLKQMFSPKLHIVWASDGNFNPILETIVPTSTTRLDTLAFVEYTEKCRMWANEFLGLQIPLPSEVTV